MPAEPMTMQFVLAPLAILAYLTATGLLVLDLRQRANLRNWAQLSGMLAIFFHAWVLVLHIPAAKGVDLNFFNAMALIGWSTALFLLLTSLVQPVISAGAVLFPMAAGTVLLTQLPISPLVLVLNSRYLDLHILFAMLAYSALAIAALLALVLWAQDKLLRHGRLSGVITRMPPLQTTEVLLFHTLFVGVALLTIALAIGFVYMHDMFAQHLVHKTVFSIASWLVFSALLLGRRLRGWRGPTAVRLTLSGMLLLILAYFGSKMVLELLLK